MPEVFTNGEDLITQPRICSNHFQEQDFYLAGGKRRLKCSAVPNVNLGSFDKENARENVIFQTIARTNVDISSSSNLDASKRNLLSEQSRNVFQSSTRQKLSVDHYWLPITLKQPSVDTNKFNEMEWKRTVSNGALDQAPTSRVDDRNQNTSMVKPDKKIKLYALLPHWYNLY